MTVRKEPIVKKNIGILGIVAVCATAVATAFVATASAHAELDSSDPADGAVLADSPASVTLKFIEEIQHTAGSYGISVKNASGQSVTAGAPTIGADSMSLSVALNPDLAGETYTVVWSNLSTDGDALTDESFSFSIGSASAVPTTMPSADALPHTHTHADMPSVDVANAGPATTGAIVAYAVPQNDSGIDGRVEVTPLEGAAMTQVGIYLNGVLDGSSHMAHIHIASTCFEGAHAADLDNIVATASGYGRSVSTVDLDRRGRQAQRARPRRSGRLQRRQRSHCRLRGDPGAARRCSNRGFPKGAPRHRLQRCRVQQLRNIRAAGRAGAHWYPDRGARRAASRPFGAVDRVGRFADDHP